MNINDNKLLSEAYTDNVLNQQPARKRKISLPSEYTDSNRDPSSDFRRFNLSADTPEWKFIDIISADIQRKLTRKSIDITTKQGAMEYSYLIRILLKYWGAMYEHSRDMIAQITDNE